MKTIEIIIECNTDPEKEKKITELGVVKYRLPMINSYVIEIPEAKLKSLHDIEQIEAIYKTSQITAQMNTARKIVNADKAQECGLSGRGVTIAILDTGASLVNDLCLPRNRIIAFKDIVGGKSEPYDDNGHGTHVAGIAAGNGMNSSGKYMGIAPEANLVIIKVLNEEGQGSSSAVLAGIQWMLDNKENYNIKIANLSVGTPDVGSRDPLIVAVEKAWDMGIVINIAAGNNGPNKTTITSPGISKKIITVGASDDDISVNIWGNSLVNFSGRGPTSECIIKPEILAPGANIISCLSNTPNIKRTRADESIIEKKYLSLSGTSMATPIVSGAVALLLEKYPFLSPDDVKLMLKRSATNLNYPKNHQGWGLLNIEKLVNMEVSYARKQNIRNSSNDSK